MCRLRVVAVALALVVGGRADGQSARGAGMRSLARSIDSLVAGGTRAKTALTAYDDSVGRNRKTLDTVIAGPFHILVSHVLRERAERAAPVAARLTEARVGSAVAHLASRWIVIRPRSGDTIVIASVSKTGQEQTDLWGNPGDTLLARWISNLAMRQLSEQVPRDVGAWLYSEVNPDSVTAADWALARLNLVSSHAAVSRRCYDGDIAACKSAMRLTPTPDPAREWLDSTGRQWFFARGPGASRYGGRPPAQEQCMAGDDRACLRALSDVDMTDWRVTINFPITPNVRASVGRLALQMGGRDAYDRLIRSRGGPGQAIADAAGAPLDSVLSVWQRRVHDTRLPSQDISPGIAVGSIVWIMFCGALSLRSSRWR